MKLCPDAISADRDQTTHQRIGDIMSEFHDPTVFNGPRVKPPPLHPRLAHCRLRPLWLRSFARFGGYHQTRIHITTPWNAFDGMRIVRYVEHSTGSPCHAR